MRPAPMLVAAELLSVLRRLCVGRTALLRTAMVGSRAILGGAPLVEAARLCPPNRGGTTVPGML